MKRADQLIEMLKRIRPANAEDCRKAGIKLKLVGYGAYREAFTLPDWPGYILKLPIGDRLRNMNLQHTLQEVRASLRIRKLKKYRPVRRYLPTIFYCDPDGRFLLVEQYKQIGSGESYDGIAAVLENLINDLSGFERGFSDVKAENLGLDKRRCVRFLDLGMFKL